MGLGLDDSRFRIRYNVAPAAAGLSPPDGRNEESNCTGDEIYG